MISFVWNFSSNFFFIFIYFISNNFNLVDEELEDILIEEENDGQITYKDEKTKKYKSKYEKFDQ